MYYLSCTTFDATSHVQSEVENLSLQTVPLMNASFSCRHIDDFGAMYKCVNLLSFVLWVAAYLL